MINSYFNFEMNLKNIKISRESMLSMLLSEETLKKDWDNKYDERWNKY